MKTYAIIKAGKVENIIEYDAQPTTPPPGFDEGFTAVQADRASPGWVYANGVFTDPNPPVVVVPPPVKSLAEQIIDNPAELAKLKTALGMA